MATKVNSHECDKCSHEVWNVWLDKPVTIASMGPPKTDPFISTDRIVYRTMNVNDPEKGVLFDETIVLAAKGSDYDTDAYDEIIYRGQRALTLDEILFTLNRKEQA